MEPSYSRSWSLKCVLEGPLATHISSFTKSLDDQGFAPESSHVQRSGRRDHALLLTSVQTGMRLSEMTGLKRQDVTLGTGAHVRVAGKGRNYDDLGNMRSSAPRRLVCPSAMGYA